MVNWNVHNLSELLNSWGIWGHLAGVVLVYVQTMVPFVPFVVIAGANVLIFGFWLGFLVNYITSVLGAVTLFLFARRFARKQVEKKLEKYAYLKRLNGRLERQGFLYITVGRIIPVLPSLVINLGAAVTKVNKRDFILGTVAGKLPMIFLESLIGHDLLYFHQNKGRLFVLSALFIGLILIGNAYKKKWFGGNRSKT